MAEPIPLFQPHLTLDRREAEVVRTAILFAMAKNITGERIGECRALEIRLHNFLSSTEKHDA